MTGSPFPTWIEINLSAIEENTRLITRQAGVPVMAVVKDDGYGHGAVEVSRAFLSAGGTWLGVVRVAEAIELRMEGITAPILVLGGAVPQEIENALYEDLSLPLYSFELAELISRAAKAAGKTARVHLKIDTGMGRFGVFPDEAVALAHAALQLGGIEIEGVFSHFAAAGTDHELSQQQMRRFDEAVQSLREAGIQPRWVHLANSGGFLHEPDSYFNLVRIGGALYGQHAASAAFSYRPRRAFAWKAQLMACKSIPAGHGVGYYQSYRTREREYIGVVPVGYGDGYQRAPGTQVLVGGQKVPVVGWVCMDQLMVSLPHCYPMGEEVVLIGQQGQEEITPEDLQKVWKTTVSAVDLVHPRVPRVYHRD